MTAEKKGDVNPKYTVLTTPFSVENQSKIISV